MNIFIFSVNALLLWQWYECNALQSYWVRERVANSLPRRSLLQPHHLIYSRALSINSAPALHLFSSYDDTDEVDQSVDDEDAVYEDAEYEDADGDDWGKPMARYDPTAPPEDDETVEERLEREQKLELEETRAKALSTTRRSEKDVEKNVRDATGYNFYKSDQEFDVPFIEEPMW